MKYLFAVILVTACTSEMDKTKNGSRLMNIDIITENLYSALSYNRGDREVLKNFETYFTEGGRLINMNQEGGDVPVVTFIENFRAQVEEGQLLGLEEKELHHVTEVFGDVAHRFSTYEAQITLRDQELIVRGINSIQLVRLKGQWKVTSWAWQDENEITRIKEDYLP